ncbi:hypothetical protein QCA50_000191 [Cerrena zonata]|uniref:F-box domain-containing protein n=1 Tax=Cerrena zonata TaxID=2478898 RepID=A0AAW0GWH3_9APHY
MKLEKTINHHSRAIARYQGRLYELEPRVHIRKLPIEILAGIFLRYRTLCHKAEPTFFYAWFRVAHVCRFWRNIVRTTPLLFSYIQTIDKAPLQMKEFLRISLETPLHIRYNGGFSDKSNWKECIPHFGRVRSLELFDNPHNTKWPTYPEVHTLSIEGSDSTRKPWFQVDDELNSIMPNLRCLSTPANILGRTWLSNKILPHTIQSLEIIDNYYLTAETMGNLIQKLSGLPHLKHLALTGLRSDPCVALLNGTTFNIPHLSSIYLAGCPSVIFLLLHHVPSTERLRLSFEGNHADFKDMTMLSQILRTKWTPLLNSELSCICDLHGSEWPDAFDMRLSSGKPCDGAFLDPSPHIRIAFSSILLNDLSPLFESLRKVMSPYLALVKYTRFKVVGEVYEHSSMIHTILDGVPYTRYLEIYIQNIPLSFHDCASRIPAVLDMPSGSGDALLSGLHRMKIELNVSHYRHGSWSFVRPFLIKLSEAICTRKLQSLEIDLSRFSHSRPEAAAKTLEEMVCLFQCMVSEVVIIPPTGTNDGASS